MVESITKKEKTELDYCSFCGKNKLEVKVLVAGPSVFICDDCVDVCNEIIKDKLAYINESKESF